MEISVEITEIMLSKCESSEGKTYLDPDFNSRSPSGDCENIVQPPSSDCSSTDFQDEIQTNNLRLKIMGLVNEMDKAIEQSFKDVKEMNDKVDIQQEEILCRKDLVKQLIKLRKDQERAIEEYTEKNESIDYRIKNLEKRILSTERYLNETCKEYCGTEL